MLPEWDQTSYIINICPCISMMSNISKHMIVAIFRFGFIIVFNKPYVSSWLVDTAHTDVCEESTPLEKQTCGKISLDTESGAGEEFLLLVCRAKALVKGMCFSQTPV